MKKRNIIISIILIAIAIIFTILVKTFDVKNVGLNGTELGFSTINKNVFETIGENSICKTITDIIGYFSLALVGFYGLVGLYQLINRKSLFKVDKEIITLGGFYIIVLSLYVLFEKVIINYRPILEDGHLAASFPSSHTLLAICVCISAIWVNKKLFKSDMTKLFNGFLLCLAVIATIGRLFSGVHWFTDIIGGIIISSALLMCFKTALMFVSKEK